MIRHAPLLVLLLVAPLAAKPPVQDPAVSGLLGDERFEPDQDVLFVTADVHSAGQWSFANSRLVRGPLSAPFRAEMSLAEASLRVVVRAEGGRVSYEVEAVGPAHPAEEGVPDGSFRVALRGTRDGFGPLAVVPFPRADGLAEIRVGATLRTEGRRDPAPGRTVGVALVAQPGGEEAGRVVRSHTLHLAPDADGEVESLVERSFLLDYEVEVAQSPTSAMLDPVPGAVPTGLRAVLLPAGNDLEVEYSYTAVLRTEEWETTIWSLWPPVRICLPILGTAAGRTTHRGDATRRPLAALADGGALFLEIR